MINWIVTASALIVVLTALRYLLRGKISLRLQYALWAIVLLRLLVPVQLGHTDFSVLNAVEENEELQITVSRPMFYVGETPDLSIPEVEPDPTLTQQEVAQLQQQLEQQYHEEMAQYATPVSPATVLQAIWIAGIAVTAIWLVVSNLRFGQMLRRSRRDTGLTCGKLTVYVSPLVDTPCLFGLLRPAVYVTEDVLGNDAVLRHVLSHEGTHYRHGDHIWSALRGVCLALHWYNPLVWLAASLSRRDAELACDEGALRRLGENHRTAYGQTLIALTCAKRRGQLLLTATTMTGSKKSLRERIKLIAKRPKMALYTLIAAVLVVAIAAGCTFTGEKEPVVTQLSVTYADGISPDEALDAKIESYLFAHADALNQLAEDSSFITEVCVDALKGTKGSDILIDYQLTYHFSAQDQTRLLKLFRSNRFTKEWQAKSAGKTTPTLSDTALHPDLNAYQFSGTVVATYQRPSVSAPSAPAGIFLAHLPAEYQLEATLERLAALQLEDVGDLTGLAGRLGADTLISLIHRAVEHQIEIVEPPAHALWAVSFGLGEKPKNSTLRMEHISLSASAEENILKITYQSLDNVSFTFYAEDSEAYWTIRNTYQSSDGPVDEEAMAPYLHLIEAEAQEWIDRSVNWPQPLNGYEIVTFRPEDSFHHEGADYAVYRFEVAFLTDDPMGAGWAGGMSLDSQGRIRHLIRDRHIVTRTVNGKTDAMIGAFDVPWSDRQNVIDTFTNRDLKDAPVTYTDMYGDSRQVVFAAKKYVLQQMETIRRITGDSDFVVSGEIRSIKAIPTGTSAENSGINLYHMDYRLHLQSGDTLYTDLGNFSYVEENGILYLKETGNLGTPVLAMEYHPQENGDRLWTFLGTFHTGDIEAQYGGDYTAAAMDIYQSAGYTAN